METTPLYPDYQDAGHYLGTVDNQDLYYTGYTPYDIHATLIARYGKEENYFSGLCFSREGILRIAAERAIEKGLLSRDFWRSRVYHRYVPYSEVKQLMLMSSEDLWKLIRIDDDRKNFSLILQIIGYRKKEA